MNILNCDNNCEIVNINCSSESLKRLNTLGIKKGCKVAIIKKSLSGVVVVTDNMEVGLSRKLAENIEVKKL